MSGLLWVKMPTAWISNKQLATHFSSNEISTDIAALKVYICLCLHSKEVSKSSYSTFCLTEIFSDRFESCMTYDHLTESASLSRVLVSRGIKKLVALDLIKQEGTTRKKVYVLVGQTRRGWCKVPRKALIKKDSIVSAFTSFTQRYSHERDALKLFLYLLSIRTNSKRFVEVSLGTIQNKTSIRLNDIDGALGFLMSIGLLEKKESRGYLKFEKQNLCNESNKLHKYWLAGNQVLNLRRALVESEYD